MGKHKTIAVVGITEEATAHLRLLMRKAAPDLRHTWKWGTEISADLLVVDPTNFAGQMARNRALGAGVPCAIYCDAEFPEAEAPLVLRKPLKLPNVVEVLNRAGEPTIATGGEVEYHTADFYFRELAEFKGDPPATGKDLWAERANPASPRSPDGLDEMIKGDPLATGDEDPRKKPLLPEDVTIEAIEEPSVRADVRGADRAEALALTLPADPTGAARKQAASETAGRPLRDYLQPEALGGPSQFAFPDGPRLTLDPKQQVFHAAGDLSTLAPLCQAMLPRVGWKTVTTGELNQIRGEQPARPYRDLLWLDALLRSNGRLASKLDPGGSYRLRERVTVEDGFRQHARIAAALGESRRLNEIAAESGASMEAVFDVVNAYDAIGALEWTPRQRRYADAEPAPPPTGPGLLGKLTGWPFGKKR